METNFRTLKESIEFSRKCLKVDLAYSAKDQLHRAAVSVSLNLSEGAGRFTRKEKRRFYRIAYGSIRECRTLLAIYFGTEVELFVKADKVAGMVWRLLQSVEVNE
ncbi:MAG: four helix bundle protein [Bacteriovoracaceae bacterium]|nr:four helix bundle protein [Bacteriovoracaceae bacterium]